MASLLIHSGFSAQRITGADQPFGSSDGILWDSENIVVDLRDDYNRSTTYALTV